MTYKEFKNWCNQRCCDGRWALNVAIFCIDVINDIDSRPFWSRNRRWKTLNNDFAIERIIVNGINRKIKEVYEKPLVE